MNFGFHINKKGNKNEYKEKDSYPGSSPETQVFTFEGEFKKGFLLQGAAPSIIRAFGGNRGVMDVVYYGLTAFTLWSSVVLAFGYFPAFLGESRLYRYLVIGLVFGIFLFSKQFARVIEYHKETQCRNCGMSAACEEFKKPILKKEISPESVTITLTSYWKCGLCGYEDTRTYHSTYNAEGKREATKTLADPVPVEERKNP